MTCVQTGSIHIDNFKNAKKNSKWYSVAIVTNQNPQKGAKNVFTPAKISYVRNSAKLKSIMMDLSGNKGFL